MFRRIFTMFGVSTLAVLGSLVATGSAAAQNQGYSVWLHRNDGPNGGSSYPSQSQAYYGSNSTKSYYDSSRFSTGSPVDSAVSINVSVPDDAEIWFDGAKTAQTGSFRRFLSPPLSPGLEYVYQVHVRWMQDGRTANQVQKFTVHAGERLNLSFGGPPPLTAAK